MSTLFSNQNPLLVGLKEHRVDAHVKELDHNRIRGGMVIETDYIIIVQPQNNNSEQEELDFEPFAMSKTYSSFRSFAHELKQQADSLVEKSSTRLPSSVEKVMKYAAWLIQLIESQPTQYLGKVNYTYVKVLAKQRSQILNDALEATLSNFPKQVNEHVFLQQVASTMLTFFLTDHLVEDDLISLGSRGSQSSRKSHQHIIRRSPGSLDDGFKTVVGGGVNAVKSVFGAVAALPKHTRHKSDQTGMRSSPTAAASGTTTKAKEQEPPPRAISESAISEQDTTSKDDEKRSDDTSSKDDEKRSDDTTKRSRPKMEKKKSIVIPMTRKNRRTQTSRDRDEDDLNIVGSDATLILDDDDDDRGDAAPSAAPPCARGTVNVSELVARNPSTSIAVAAAILAALRAASLSSVTLDMDIFLLIVFGAFCVGLHAPRELLPTTPEPAEISPAMPISQKDDGASRKVLRRSFVSTPRNSLLFTPTRSDTADAAAAVTAASLENENSTKEAAETNEEGLVTDDDDDDDKENQQQLMVATAEVQQGKDDALLMSMERFPKGAELGSHLNRWSQPAGSNFQVRGPNYFKDRKKVPSDEFLFPIRGVDLFLTDTPPENVGRNSSIFAGNLRDLPTFIVNFRLPWGVLLFYFEIPERFLPFLKARYEGETFDASTLPSSPGDRTVCRFLMGDDEHKKTTLKIVPVVVQGPWIVKSVVGGKPAIIGNKLPVNYVYQPASHGRACYLEADLDIVGSSAARGILSVTKTYTQVLTIDLGFVVQGNEEDELPEQMLVGARLHGIDPDSAPKLPPMAHSVPDDEDEDPDAH